MSSLFELSKNDSDQLRELVNIGVSHASDSLSVMMKKRITMNIPTLSIYNATTLFTSSDYNEEVTVSVLLRMHGHIDGYVFLVFPYETATTLVASLSQKSITDIRTLDAFDRSIFQEIGNVVTGGMLSGLSRFLDVEMHHSVPNVVIDMQSAILHSLQASMFQLHEEFFLLDVSLCVDPKNDDVVCSGAESTLAHMYIFLGQESVEKILAITNAMTK